MWSCGTLPRVSYLVAMPCTLVLLLVVICTAVLGDRAPRSVEDWQAVYVSWKQWPTLRDRYQALVSLMSIHALQVVFCFPFTNITKTMYGYVFGFWQGLVVACAWEIALVLLYLFVASHCSHPPGAFFPREMLEYVKTWQASRLTFAVLLVVHMTSIPLLTKSTLLRQDAVTSFEFIASSVLATLLLSAKDTLAGDYIAQSDDSTANIAFYSAVVLCSSLLPGLLTSLLMLRICTSQPRTRPDLEHGPGALRAQPGTPPPSRAHSRTPSPSRAPARTNTPRTPSPSHGSHETRDDTPLIAALSPSCVEGLARVQPPKQEILDTPCIPEPCVHVGVAPPLRPPRREVRVSIPRPGPGNATDERPPS